MKSILSPAIATGVMVWSANWKIHLIFKNNVFMMWSIIQNGLKMSALWSQLQSNEVSNFQSLVPWLSQEDSKYLWAYFRALASGGPGLLLRANKQDPLWYLSLSSISQPASLFPLHSNYIPLVSNHILIVLLLHYDKYLRGDRVVFLIFWPHI